MCFGRLLKTIVVYSHQFQNARARGFTDVSGAIYGKLAGHDVTTADSVQTNENDEVYVDLIAHDNRMGQRRKGAVRNCHATI
jgi:hypothetical protein